MFPLNTGDHIKLVTPHTTKDAARFPSRRDPVPMEGSKGVNSPQALGGEIFIHSFLKTQEIKGMVTNHVGEAGGHPFLAHPSTVPNEASHLERFL